MLTSERTRVAICLAMMPQLVMSAGLCVASFKIGNYLLITGPDEEKRTPKITAVFATWKALVLSALSATLKPGDPSMSSWSLQLLPR